MRENRALSKPKASRRFEELRARGFRPSDELPEAMRTFRAGLLAGAADHRGKAYQLDLATGLTLYRILPLTVRQAADDDLWRYLSIEVVPDLVNERAKGNDAYFWSSRWRIWLKRIWWYIHLGWQGSEEATSLALQGGTTDTIAQLVERPGKGGFRVELLRAIVARFHRERLSEDQLRRLMKLNTAWLAAVEPALSKGGVEGYVDRLLKVTLEGGRRHAA